MIIKSKGLHQAEEKLRNYNTNRNYSEYVTSEMQKLGRKKDEIKTNEEREIKREREKKFEIQLNYFIWDKIK